MAKRIAVGLRPWLLGLGLVIGGCSDPAGTAQDLGGGGPPDSVDMSAPGMQRPGSTDPLTVRGMTITMDQVVQFAPIVSLHTAESYLPCSIEYLLSGATLIDDAGGKPPLPNPTQQDLYQNAGSNFRVVIDPSRLAGEPLDAGKSVSAPMYVAVQVPADQSYVDLTFIFLFTYNGAQCTRVKVPFADFNCIVQHFAEHQGDIEGMTVRVKPDFSAVLQVRYEAHGDSTFYNPSDVAFMNNHALARLGLDSHASYNGLGKNDNDWITLASYSAVGLGADFVDIITRTGPLWTPFGVDGSGRAVPNGGLRFVGLNDQDEPVNAEVWAKFSGRLGSHQSNSYDDVVGIGSPLTGAQHGYASTLAQAVVAAGLVPADDRAGDGPGGLGGRDYIHLNQK